MLSSHVFYMRNNQSMKGAVVVTFSQNEEDVIFQMDIDSHISLAEQAGKISLVLVLFLWMRFGGQFPSEILLLPHSVRGSCQLLLSIRDRSTIGVLFVFYIFPMCTARQ